MAYSVLFACDTCDFDAVLVYAQEWEAGRQGEIVPYSGYGKISGLVNRLWCPTCRTVRPFVLLRLEPAAEHAVIAYAEAQRLGLTGQERGPCPVCTTPLTGDADGQICPQCETGLLCRMGEWEDAV